MKHLLMDPAFPDIVGEYAIRQVTETRTELTICANDNGDEVLSELSDPLFAALCAVDVAATRLW